MQWVLLNLGKVGLNPLISCEHVSWATMVKTLTEELSGAVITATAATAPRQHHRLIRMRLTARTAIHQHWHTCYLIPCEGFPTPSYRPRTQANQTDRVITATYLLENKATHTLCRTHVRLLCQDKYLSLFAWANLPHFYHSILGSTERISSSSAQPERIASMGKSIQRWGKGTGILECFSRSPFKKLYTRARHIRCHLRERGCCHQWKMGT